MKSVKAMIGLAVVAAFAGWMIGCDALNPADTDSATITISSIDSIPAGFPGTVKGEIKGDPQLDNIVFTILKDGEEVTDGSVDYEALSNYTDEKSVKLQELMEITTEEEACNGIYTLQIEVTAGSATSKKSETFKVYNGSPCDGSGTGTPIEGGTVFTAGAQSANAGSYINLDADTAYITNDAVNHVTDIDLFYGVHGGEEKLMSPAWSRNNGFMAGEAFVDAISTQLFKTELTAAEFNAITTKEEIQALWDDAEAVTSGVVVADGDVVIAKTSEGATALMLITSQTEGQSGTITAKVAR